MEFFDWLTVPQIVLGYVNFTVDTAAEAASRMRWILVVCVLVAAALYLAGHLCGGFGLMKMAKKQGIKYWWLGFIPFGNTYLTGKLAGETRIFGSKCKRIGLYATLAEVFYVILEIALLVITFILIDGQFYELVEVKNAEGEITHAYYEFSDTLFKEQFPEYAWILTLQNVLYYIARVWVFVALFLFCFMFSAFFRKYYARSPFLMTFLCAIMPFRGFVLLAVRNNTPVDYTAYMQRRYEQMRQQQQPPYGGQGGYNQGGYGQSGSGDPFSEFGGSSNGNAGGSPGDASNGNAGGGSNDSPFSDF